MGKTHPSSLRVISCGALPVERYVAQSERVNDTPTAGYRYFLSLN
jgi:hypothetical protein